MKRAILSAIVVVATVAGVSAQDARNFVGTWRTDLSRSKVGAGGQGPDQTITVEGNKMTVTQTTAGNSSSRVFMLDGTPSKIGENIVTCKWEGNVLVATVSTPGGERITTVERRSMEPDGAMRVELTVNFSKEAVEKRPAGAPTTENWHRVYNKIK